MSQLSSRARVELAKAALSRIGLESPELRPYQDEPAQMPSGTVGKDGYLRLEFSDRGDRSVMAFMDLRVPFLFPPPLRQGGDLRPFAAFPGRSEIGGMASTETDPESFFESVGKSTGVAHTTG